MAVFKCLGLQLSIVGYLIPVCFSAFVDSGEAIKATFACWVSSSRKRMTAGGLFGFILLCPLTTLYAVILLTRASRLTAVAGTSFTGPINPD